MLSASGSAVLVLILAGTASAQTAGFQPLRQPVWAPGGHPVLLSPYLNLLRGGDIASNYYLGTLAEAQRRQYNYVFRTDIEDLNARTRFALEEAPRPRGPVTSGTYAVINNLGGFYNNTSYYFPNAPRPPSALYRPGTYLPPPGPVGAPARYGISSGFPPVAPAFTPR
jgi:hypothetical protein